MKVELHWIFADVRHPCLKAFQLLWYYLLPSCILDIGTITKKISLLLLQDKKSLHCLRSSTHRRAASQICCQRVMMCLFKGGFFSMEVLTVQSCRVWCAVYIFICTHARATSPTWAARVPGGTSCFSLHRPCSHVSSVAQVWPVCTAWSTRLSASTGSNNDLLIVILTSYQQHHTHLLYPLQL